MRKQRVNNQLIYGRNPVLEALNSGLTLERIYLKAGISGDWEKDLIVKCRELDIPLKRVPLIKLDKLTSNKNHQGIVALTSLIQYQKIEDVIPLLFEQGKTPVLIMLDNVSDVRNIGAIARSIEVLGADALILSGKNAGMLNEDAFKTSAGALSKVNVCREVNSNKTLELLTSYGITTVASTLDAKPITMVDLKSPICLVLGSEGDGLQPAFARQCTTAASIPQLGTTNSLNVSVAAGIMIYEIMRQRGETS